MERKIDRESEKTKTMNDNNERKKRMKGNWSDLN